jgi:anti-sigma B factor antagonist
VLANEGSASDSGHGAREAAESEVVLVVSGEIDTVNASALDRAIASALQRKPRSLVFELGELRFIDSAGIAVLVRAASMVNTVKLRNPSAMVRRIVEVTGLSNVLRIEP